MKTLLLLSSLLLATPAVASEYAGSPDPIETNQLDYFAHLLSPANVARGMSPREVSQKFGTPDAQLAANVWVYWNFKAREQPRAEQNDTLLVIFADNRVERVRLCASGPVRAFVAQQENKTRRALAAK